MPEWASTLIHIPNPSEQKLDKLGFKAAIFEWSSVVNKPHSQLRTEFRLGPLDVTFPLEKLTLVTGHTGSGKTALLNALLGG